MKKYSIEFWDDHWSRPCNGYNRQHQKVWNILLPLLTGKVADLGCGSCAMYVGTKVDLIGIDLSREALCEARKNYREGNFILASAEHTGLPDKSADTVIASGLLDYADDWTSVVSEMRRISRGDIYATVFNNFLGHQWDELAVRSKTNIESFTKLDDNWYLIKF